MYQALYRKYRPKTFDDVVGQKVIVKTLENEIKSNKINHAYLFCGPRGTGKTSIARIFAKIVNCKNPDGYLPCNKCVSCTQINNDDDIDIIEIDAASNSGVADIRDLKSKVNLVPAISEYKVYIIDEVHMLSTDAFNALLKTLEEPPHHVIFILATTDPYKLPVTIISRCQRFDFKKVKQSDIVQRLKYIAEKEKIIVDESVLCEIARLSDGGLRDAISMMDQLVSYCDKKITISDVHDINGTITQKELSTFIYNMVVGNLKESFQFLDDCDNNGKSIVKLTDEILLYLKNTLLVKLSIIKDTDDTYKLISENISQEDIIRMIRKINDSLNDMKYSDNAKLILELAIIDYSTTLLVKKDIVVTDIKELSKENTKIASIKETEVKKEEKAELPVTNLSSDSEEKNESNYFPGNNSDVDINKLKSIRVNNSLSGYSYHKTQQFKKECGKFNDLIFDKKFGKYASLLMDGEIKSIGNDYIIFVYKDATNSEMFNNNLINVEKTIEKALDHCYKVIATNSDDWAKIKESFKNNKESFKFIQETTETLKKIGNNKKNSEFEAIFGSIIEYK